jgi:hypothetical protein
MTSKDMLKHIEAAGTKIAKDKIMDALRRTPEKDIAFIKDTATGYAVIRVKLT